MTSRTKSERLDLRLTAEQKQQLEMAADIEGRSMSDFTVHAVTERAAEVIRQQGVLRLQAEEWDEFVAIVDRAAQPNERLQELFTRPSVFEDE